jgi:uncharacterized surface protein with fasciclin (FAS1) repeats
MMKKIYSGAGALALALALAACGGAPSTANTNPTAASGADQGASGLPALDPTAPTTGSGDVETEAYPGTGATSALPDSSATSPSTGATSALPDSSATSPSTGATSAGVVAAVAADPRFSTLTTLLEDSGLAAQLDAAGPVTIFAPTNEAFAALPPETLTALGQDPTMLQQILLYHVAAGALSSTDLTAESSAPTLAGEDLQVAASSGTVTVNEMAQVIEPDIAAGTSVIHAIDQVLLPSSVAMPPATGG